MNEEQLMSLWGDGSAYLPDSGEGGFSRDAIRAAAIRFAAAASHKEWERGYIHAKDESSAALLLVTTAAHKEWDRGYEEGFDNGFYKAVGIKNEQV